ncbi:MAG: HlyD family type I secretion periplasmic adaptor subunit [Alphaproteobacteria bacterium]|nr:HlyD family type I secretion periplasmic adaptor subunit [Alphaproteobacteria bacterium]
MAFVAIFLVWAQFARLEEVSVALGEVVPQGQVKVIQHLEGGIIGAIFVQEGDAVQEGTPLVQLDVTASRSSREELQVNSDGMLLSRARLLTEARGGAQPEWPGEVGQRRPDIQREEREMFAQRAREHASTLLVLTDQVRQRELDIQQLGSQRRAVNENLRLARERFGLAKDLVKDGLIPKLEYLNLEAEMRRLEGDLGSLDPATARAHAALAEAQSRIAEERNKFRSRAQDELSRLEVNIARVQESLTRASDQMLRTEIKSPIQGVVKSMRYHTIGGVVRPGDAIMDIVPSLETLVVEAKLNPTDVGYVRVGQPTVVKVTTYDYARYGGLEGKVIYLSADSHTDDKGNTFFRVISQTDKSYLGSGPTEFPIAPGMQATVDIHTGDRSVMEYLIKPVLKLKTEAFRER